MRCWCHRTRPDDSFQELKGNRQVCGTAVAISQSMLLTEKADMDQIVVAIGKIQSRSEELVRVIV